MTAILTNSALNQSVLVLNKHYMALRVINVKRAIAMLYRSHAEVVSYEQGAFFNHDYISWQEVSEYKRSFEPDAHDWILTVDRHIAVPRIVRLLFYDRLPRQYVKLNRRNIFARDKNSCQYCGKKFSTSELSIDHVVPKSQGGQSSWRNLVCACTKCNCKKGGRTPKQVHMRLITEPVKPKRNPLVHIHLTHPRYQSWKQFLDNAYWSVELK